MIKRIAVLLFLVATGLAAGAMNLSKRRLIGIDFFVQSNLKRLLGLIPSLFTGFVCCVPTFLLSLGTVSTSFTIFFIDIRRFLVPLSLILLSANLIWSLRDESSEEPSSEIGV